MADKFTKVVVDSPAAPEAPADAWKNVSVEKEHQPAKQKSTVTYAQLESQKASQEAQKSACDDRIAEIEAEMAKVKAAVEA
jgi:septal ring factor EnvC (AmiA/AmiB activator)